MILKEYKKHTALARSSFGIFGRNEWALIGAPCDVIKETAGLIIAALSPLYKCAYADASHSNDIAGLLGRLADGAVLEYSDQTHYQQLNFNGTFTPFKLKEVFAGVDMVLVNGNHHQAKAQVIIISESKKNSLQKRIAQLTDVRLFLLADGATDIFDFLKTAIPGWQQIPILQLAETDKIIAFFNDEMRHTRPTLNGLVLAGGKSERMGFDKSSISWHGKEQRYHIADMLKPFCNDVFISVQPGQQNTIDADYNSLPDTFTGLGPYGGILSAFREKPDSAWLVIACDLPLMDTDTLRYLVDERKTASVATAYLSDSDGLPEPLICIWEPKAYPVLLSFLALGYSCPRKVLINSDAALLTAQYPDALTNVNTPDDFDKIKMVIDQNAPQYEAR